MAAGDRASSRHERRFPSPGASRANDRDARHQPTTSAARGVRRVGATRVDASEPQQGWRRRVNASGRLLRSQPPSMVAGSHRVAAYGLLSDQDHPLPTPDLGLGPILRDDQHGEMTVEATERAVDGAKLHEATNRLRWSQARIEVAING
jgi:hypothetical protein